MYTACTGELVKFGENACVSWSFPLGDFSDPNNLTLKQRFCLPSFGACVQPLCETHSIRILLRILFKINEEIHSYVVENYTKIYYIHYYTGILIIILIVFIILITLYLKVIFVYLLHNILVRFCVFRTKCTYRKTIYDAKQLNLPPFSNVRRKLYSITRRKFSLTRCLCCIADKI